MWGAMAEGSESRKALGQEHLRTLVNREVSVVQVWSVREEGTEKRDGGGCTLAGELVVFFTVEHQKALGRRLTV